MTVSSAMSAREPRLSPASRGSRALLSIAQALVSATRLSDVLPLAIELARACVEADAVYLLLEREGAWTIQAQARFSERSGGPIGSVALDVVADVADVADIARVSATIVDYVACTGSRFIWPHASRVGMCESASGTSMRPIAYVPLLNRRRVRAMLYLEKHDMAEPFPADGLETLEMFSGLMAVAIEHARHIGELELQTGELAFVPRERRVEQPTAAPTSTDGVGLEGLGRSVPTASRRTTTTIYGADGAHARAARLAQHAERLLVEADRNRLRTLLVAAEAAEVRFRGLLDAAPDAIVITDRDGHIALVNQQTEAMFGYPREELMGKPVEVLIPERYRALHTSHRSRYAALPLRRPMGAGLELSGRRRDGSEFPVEITLSPIVAQPGMHIACTIRDVTDRRRVENALRESERFTHSTIDALSEHICVLDETGTIIAVNKAWREFSAAGGSDLMGCTEGDNYLATCDAATGTGAAEATSFGDGIRAVMRGEREECLIEYPSPTATGPRWYMGRATRFTGDGPIRVVVSFENVTELKRAELAIREAKNAAEAAKREEAERRQEAERRRQIAESLRDALSILNSDRPLGDVLDYIALQANRLLGGQAAAVYRSGEDGEWVIIHTEHGAGPNPAATVWIPVDLDTLSQILMTHRAIVVSDLAAARAGMDSAPRRSVPPAFVVPVTDGYQAILAVPIVLNDEVYGGLVLYDSVPRKFSLEEIELAVMFADQAALAIENARLKDEAKQAAVAAERNRLARDLHDAVTQVIFSASLIADALPRVWERNPEEGHKGLEELRQLTRGALAELRTLLFELRPAALLEKPLSDLLRQLTEATANRTRAPISFVFHGSCDVPAAVQVAIYRIAQEALSNVAKHADASQIGIHLGCSSHRLVLRVRDDGCGFVKSEVPAGHLGVEIMQERARSVGAVCRITSKPGKGTQVVVTWPAPAHTGGAAGRRASRRSSIPRGVHKSGQ